MLSAPVVSAIYREWSDVPGLLLASAITTLVGFGLWRIFDRPGELSTREGFAAVGLAWIALAMFGALPFLLTGSIANVTDAVFEASAGFTTTGASVLPDPGLLPNGVLFWRSLTQWIGGMGIIVLSIAILPLLGMGAHQLARAESPGPMPDRLTPRFKETAKRLWVVYLVLTVVETGLLWVGDMTLFEAINHSLTTMSTGGFSTNAGSLGAFSDYSQWIVIVFMTLAGVSFALHYKVARRDWKAYFRSVELRVYLSIVAVAAVLMVIGTWGGSVAETIRNAVFTSLTIVTTTGFATVDFGAWIPALGIMIVGLMFVGGMAGSTAGSIKTDRLNILYEASRTDVRRLIHPRGVFVTRVGRTAVPDLVVETVQTFFLLYMFAFMTGTFVMAILVSLSGADTDVVTIVSSVDRGESSRAANRLDDQRVPTGGERLVAGRVCVPDAALLAFDQGDHEPLAVFMNRL